MLYVVQGDLTSSGNSETRIRVVFKATGTSALLAWGGHIGRQIDWGTANSAVGINGSPYHMRLKGFCPGSNTNTNVLCDTGGNQDRSLSAASVFAPGTIVIVKNTVGGDGQFGFTGTGSGVNGFTLNTDPVSGIAQTSTKTKRADLDQARMQLLQQYFAAVLNVHAFGSSPAGTSLATARAAYCGTNVAAIRTQAGLLGAFNTSGDNLAFTPGASATAQESKRQADIVFWDTTLR